MLFANLQSVSIHYHLYYHNNKNILILFSMTIIPDADIDYIRGGQLVFTGSTVLGFVGVPFPPASLNTYSFFFEKEEELVYACSSFH